jgi:sulfur transfer protein SufE
MNKKEKLAAQEREERAVLARLASSDVVSLKHKENVENSFQNTMDDYDSLMKLAKKLNKNKKLQITTSQEVASCKMNLFGLLF